MNYKAFYRTYRPSNFSEVVGQDHIVRTLVNLIRMNKISHGYLFCGPRGTGKTSIAKIFASAINCIHSEFPEQICQRCAENVNTTLDIIEIDAASNNSVNDIRTIREQGEFAPTNSPYKIYIIDEVHMLSKGAFNALLMTLEEPPAHAIFILATTNPDKIPDTILSRVQRYNFKRISKSILESQLRFVFNKENINYDEESIDMIATLANGSLRDALSIADQINAYSNSNIKLEALIEIFGLSTVEAQVHFLNLLANKSVSESLQYFDNLVNNGVDISRFIISLINLLKDYLVYESTKNSSLVSSDIQMLEMIIIKNEFVYKILDILTPLLNDIKYSDIPQQLVQLAIIKICSFEDSMIDIQKKDVTSELLKTATMKIDTSKNKTKENSFSNTNTMNSINIPNYQTKTQTIEKTLPTTIEQSFSNTKKIHVTQTNDFNEEYRDITDEYFATEMLNTPNENEITQNEVSTQSQTIPIPNNEIAKQEKTETKTLLSDYSNEDIEKSFEDLMDDFSLEDEVNKLKSQSQFENQNIDINSKENQETINELNKTIEEKLNQLKENTLPLDFNSSLNESSSTTQKIIDDTTELLNISHEADGSEQEVSESLLRDYDTAKQVFDTNEINVQSNQQQKIKTAEFSNQDDSESYSFKSIVTNEMENESSSEILKTNTTNINNVVTKEFEVNDVKPQTLNKTQTFPNQVQIELTQPKIINLFLLSQKPTFEIFKKKLQMSTCSDKEEHDSFTILLKEAEFICSSNDFILVSSKEDWVVDDINKKLLDPEFKSYISEFFGNNTHFFAITKKDYILSKELYVELKKSGRVPEAKPLNEITHIIDNDKIRLDNQLNDVESKSKQIFGNIFSRKKE